MTGHYQVQVFLWNVGFNAQNIITLFWDLQNIVIHQWWIESHHWKKLPKHIFESFDILCKCSKKSCTTKYFTFYSYVSFTPSELMRWHVHDETMRIWLHKPITCSKEQMQHTDTEWTRLSAFHIWDMARVVSCRCRTANRTCYIHHLDYALSFWVRFL